MTGPEHYAEAERLIALIDSQQNAIPEQRLAHAALAHVHATLAQAAATLDVQLNEHLLAAWAEVLS